MSELFASGRIVDGILVLVTLEAIGLLVWHSRTGRGPAPRPLLCNLASGAALMLGIRAALTGGAWPVVASCLLASLIAHASELALRLRERPARSLRRSQDVAPPGTELESVAFPGRALT